MPFPTRVRSVSASRSTRGLSIGRTRKLTGGEPERRRQKGVSSHAPMWPVRKSTPRPEAVAGDHSISRLTKRIARFASSAVRSFGSWLNSPSCRPRFANAARRIRFRSRDRSLGKRDLEVTPPRAPEPPGQLVRRAPDRAPHRERHPRGSSPSPFRIVHAAAYSSSFFHRIWESGGSGVRSQAGIFFPDS